MKNAGTALGGARIGILALCTMAASLAGWPGSAVAAAKQSDVFVIGTLHSRHAKVPAYSHDVLRRIITQISPEVVVFDVTPEELAKQAVHPSKKEYPQVIFPFIAAGRYEVHAAEPAEPQFTQIQADLKKALATNAEERPQAVAALDGLSAAMYSALEQHWTSAAKVHDALTMDMLRAEARLNGSLSGPVIEKIATDWDQHTAEIAIRAAKASPGTRVLVVTGVRNRPFVVEHLFPGRLAQDRRHACMVARQRIRQLIRVSA